MNCLISFSPSASTDLIGVIKSKQHMNINVLHQYYAFDSCNFLYLVVLNVGQLIETLELCEVSVVKCVKA